MYATHDDEEAIFKTACQIHSPQEREDYLQRVCGDDEALLDRLAVLLRAFDENRSFLERPAMTVDYSSGERPGTTIGPYKLLQQIGEGGMGTVFMAEQTEPVQRKVALKIIKPGMDSKQVIARFEAERQALALMDHPNIARVLDGGETESGRPYFVMDLVKGVPITQYCDEQHLTVKQRLELLLPVCLAVQHAHQKGIIHRDLKPSNILVALYDEKPVPKVIDFGVAKAAGGKLTERTLFTAYGALVGTLEYMSPEQAKLNELDVDTRSDVYSLGVLLYELLTGTTPLQHQSLKDTSILEILRHIREDDTPRPSLRLSTIEDLPNTATNRGAEPKKLSGLVRGELDWIVLKALEKERGRRYESVSALAADVRRFLNDEPVQACPPSTAYRFRKFARRNKTILSAAGLIALILMLATAFSVWQAHDALVARNASQQSEARAIENLDTALESVDNMLTRLGEEKLADAPYMEEIRRELLEDALKTYRKIFKQSGNQARVGLETAMAERRVAKILKYLGRNDEAKKAVDRALGILNDLDGSAHSQSTVNYEKSRCWLLKAALGTGNSKTRLAYQDKSVALLETLVKSSARTAKQESELAFALCVRAKTLQNLKQQEEAKKSYQAAEDLYRKVLDSNPADRDAAISYAKHLQNFGLFYMNAGEYETAEAKYKKAVAICEQLAKADKLNAESQSAYASALGNVGSALYRQERYKEADSYFQNAIELLHSLVRDYPSVPRFRQHLSGIEMAAVGNSFLLGDPKGALKHSEDAIQQAKSLTDNWPKIEQYHGIYGAALTNLANVLFRQDSDLERAEKLVTEAIKHQRLAAPNPNSPNKYLLIAYVNLTQIRLKRGRPMGALQAAHEGLEVGQRILEYYPEDPVTAANMKRLRQLQNVITNN